jgi:hypothetical protein
VEYPPEINTTKHKLIPDHMNKFSDKTVIAFIVAFFVFVLVVILLMRDQEIAIRTDLEKKEIELKVGK